MIVNVQELSIGTTKGHSLAAFKFSSEKNIDKTIIISSATGVLQKYYSKFATCFADHGFTVYTFDYNGIGKSGSKTSQLKNNSCDLKSWGQIDQAAVVAYVKKENENAQLTLITHSVGGQILGFNPNYQQIDKVVMVASQGGYWKDFKGIHYPKMWLLWYVVIPGLTPLFGYFPAKKLGLFENLPKNMVYEWAKWGKKKEYMMHFFHQDDYFFENIKVPLLSMSFAKDNFAPRTTVDWMANQYKNAIVNRVHYGQAIDSKMVKHFGFFKKQFEKTLWKSTLNWILEGTKPQNE